MDGKAFLKPLASVYRAGTASTIGAKIAEYSYDGAGRRIVKANAETLGDLATTEHYYHAGQRQIETRDGSEQVLKQHVWGLMYVDELVQIGVNQDPLNAFSGTNLENNCEWFFYALHDANFNVLGVVNKTGRLVERYEYTPYGERTVYSKGWLVYDLNGDGRVNTNDLVYYEPGVLAQIASPDSFVDVTGDGECDADDFMAVSNAIGATVSYGNDALVMNPTLGSHRTPGGTTGADGVALCAFGHQGLYHDEATGLVYNRARMLHPKLGRFAQRDPLEYVDGLSQYTAYHIQNGELDPLGNKASYTGKQIKAKVISSLIAQKNRHSQYWYYRGYLAHEPPTKIKEFFSSVIAAVNKHSARKFGQVPEDSSAMGTYHPFYNTLKVAIDNNGKVRDGTVLHESIHLYHDAIGRWDGGHEAQLDELAAHVVPEMLKDTTMDPLRQLEQELNKDHPDVKMLEKHWQLYWTRANFLKGIPYEWLEGVPPFQKTKFGQVSYGDIALINLTYIGIECDSLADLYNAHANAGGDELCIEFSCYMTGNFIPSRDVKIKPKQPVAWPFTKLQR